jgi:hypothetical protein
MRLYGQPQFRGQGDGYREMPGDTMPVMRRALAIYERLGFEQTESTCGWPCDPQSPRGLR